MANGEYTIETLADVASIVSLIEEALIDRVEDLANIRESTTSMRDLINLLMSNGYDKESYPVSHVKDLALVTERPKDVIAANPPLLP